MLSQFNKDIDIDINYRLPDNYSNNDVEVALSTQMINDKLIISTNVDVGGTNQKLSATTLNSSNSAFIGEGDVQLKLTDNGKLRLIAFNRSNQSDPTQPNPYTSGIGFLYKEDFNSLGALMRKYVKLVFKHKQKPAKVPAPNSISDSPMNVSQKSESPKLIVE